MSIFVFIVLVLFLFHIILSTIDSIDSIHLIAIMVIFLLIFFLLTFLHGILESYRKKWFKRRHEMMTAETDLLKWVLLKKRLSCQHLSVEGVICYHACFVCVVGILIIMLHFIFGLFDSINSWTCFGIVFGRYSADLYHLYQKMKYRQVKTDNSFEDIESKVNAWTETLTSEKDRKVSWKKVCPSEGELRIAMETDPAQEYPFIIHVVKNNTKILFNLVGIGEEYNHSLGKDFHFLPKFLRTDYTMNYYTHCEHLDHLEGVLRGQEDSATEK